MHATKRSKATNAFTQSLCSAANRWHLLCGNLMMGFDLMCHTPLMDLSKMPLVQCSVSQVSVKSYHRYIKVSHTHNIWTFFSNVAMGFKLCVELIIGMEFGWSTYKYIHFPARTWGWPSSHSARAEYKTSFWCLPKGRVLQALPLKNSSTKKVNVV